MNGVIIQFFHWYHPGNLWNEFAEKAEYLKDLGFTAVWFPPANKCSLNREGRGYDVYDLYDLGEFDQKGSIPTRYGTKAEYLLAIEKAHGAGMSVYADIVLNHRMGGDEEEKIMVHQLNEENRNERISENMEVSAYTKFTFPGRKGVYSDFIWDYRCFSGIDYVIREGEEMKGVFKIHNEYGEEWTDTVSHQFGNYDYLMGADIEYRNPYVVEEMKNWIRWYMETTKVDGIRLDALKHISSDFLKDWIYYIKTEVNPECFVLGEFWKDEAEKIEYFSDKMSDLISCFDAPLHYNFFKASQDGKDYDMSRILKGSFLEKKPVFSVSFVENHDTQQLQALESAVKDWFKPLAYAIILLTDEAYPCIFYPDLFGADYIDIKDEQEVHIIMPKVEELPGLLEARKLFAYGEQIDYFDHPNCVAFVRKGDEKHPGCIVILSNSEEGYKEIELGKEHADSVYTDFLKNRHEEIYTDKNGKAVFTVNSGSVSIWVKKQTP
ncbi:MULTISPECIES: alpha-amylase [unclassified Chryseobacterium]|uniref:alpha-amylase n=1 Tax=unclassified Chryseobacterium TaxID=2593645 RepID=UPI000D71B204|nr:MULTISPECIES: alpha-amylase [unclassified Chryseobacterium]PWW29234.1 alpha-amylase [Chryseobacterium sp. AG844]